MADGDSATGPAWRHHFLITNVSGNPIYCDFPSALSCLVLNGLQQFVSSSLHGLTIRCIRSPHWQILIEQRQGMWFALASPLGESRLLMQRRLAFLEQLFVFKFGKTLIALLQEQPQISLLAYHQSFQDIVQTYLHLCESEQSFLVHALEPLCLEPTVSTPVHGALRDAARSVKASTVHMVLFVGCKLVATFRAPLAPELTQSETMQLLVYTQTESVRKRVRHRSSSSSSSGSADLVSETVYLQCDQQPHSAVFARLFRRTTLVVVTSTVVATLEEKTALRRLQEATARHLRVFADYLLVREHAHITWSNYVFPLPGLVHFILIDRTHNRMLAPALRPLFEAHAATDPAAPSEAAAAAFALSPVSPFVTPGSAPASVASPSSVSFTATPVTRTPSAATASTAAAAAAIAAAVAPSPSLQPSALFPQDSGMPAPRTAPLGPASPPPETARSDSLSPPAPAASPSAAHRSVSSSSGEAPHTPLHGQLTAVVSAADILVPPTHTTPQPPVAFASPRRFAASAPVTPAMGVAAPPSPLPVPGSSATGAAVAAAGAECGTPTRAAETPLQAEAGALVQHLDGAAGSAAASAVSALDLARYDAFKSQVWQAYRLGLARLGDGTALAIQRAFPFQVYSQLWFEVAGRPVSPPSTQTPPAAAAAVAAAPTLQSPKALAVGASSLFDAASASSPLAAAAASASLSPAAAGSGSASLRLRRGGTPGSIDGGAPTTPGRSHSSGATVGSGPTAAPSSPAATAVFCADENDADRLTGGVRSALVEPALFPKLVQGLFRGLSAAQPRCYEVHALFVGGVSVEQMQEHMGQLLALLHSGFL